MGRYLLKFSKENNLKYISHLDLLRVFQRAFKRAHIRLRYSQGFNPHAKIGFGQPLSLGSESTGEYMEFETVEDRAGGEYLTALSGCMPDGIRLLSCTKLKEEGKTSLAAAVAYASLCGEIPRRWRRAASSEPTSERVYQSGVYSL